MIWLSGVLRAVNEAIQDLARTVDARLRATLTPGVLWRRLRARAGGVSGAELALLPEYFCIMGRGDRSGLLGNLIIGILGSAVGGWLSDLLFGWGGVTGFNWRSLLVAVGGACLLLLIFGGVRRRRG